MQGRLWYYPNPAHKTTTSEAGPPRWYPDKTACPESMTIEERETLIDESVSESGDALDPSRFAVRRVEGSLEWYRCHLTRHHPDGRVEIHGHPFQPGYPKVPPRVLRQLCDRGTITPVEYNRLVRA